MILVTVGTQKQQFYRIFEMVENLNVEEQVIMQLGYTVFNSKKHRTTKFLDNFEEMVKKADIIITHGGVGSVIKALKLKKKIIIVPRLMKYQEHIDDHQQEVAVELFHQNFCLMANNKKELKQNLEIIRQIEFAKFISNNENFNKQLQKIIVNL